MSVVPLRGRKRTAQADGNAAAAVVSALEFDILFGRLRPRERLVEDALMQRFRAKRHVVRQALADLETMGIIVRAPNRGATVRDFTAQEVEEICELREILQHRAAQRIALPASPELLAKLQAIQRRHDKAVAARDPRAIDKANEEFHHELFAACGSAQLLAAIEHYAYLTRAMRLYPLVNPTILDQLRREHWAMIEALKGGDRKALQRLVVDHIQPSKKIYLEVRREVDASSMAATGGRRSRG
jgi:DNA-binding GntR family transcriptional regulator